MNEQQTKCEWCHEWFKKGRGLSIHRATCIGVMNRTCTKCKEVFSTIGNKVKHETRCKADKMVNVQQQSTPPIDIKPEEKSAQPTIKNKVAQFDVKVQLQPITVSDLTNAFKRIIHQSVHNNRKTNLESFGARFAESLALNICCTDRKRYNLYWKSDPSFNRAQNDQGGTLLAQQILQLARSKEHDVRGELVSKINGNELRLATLEQTKTQTQRSLMNDESDYDTSPSNKIVSNFHQTLDCITMLNQENDLFKQLLWNNSPLFAEKLGSIITLNALNRSCVEHRLKAFLREKNKEQSEIHQGILAYVRKHTISIAFGDRSTLVKDTICELQRLFPHDFLGEVDHVLYTILREYFIDDPTIHEDMMKELTTNMSEYFQLFASNQWSHDNWVSLPMWIEQGLANMRS
jgi:hypothetical protein